MSRMKINTIDGLYVRLVEPRELTTRLIEMNGERPLLKDPVNKLIEQERFRQFLLKNGVARDVVMSRLDYSETSDIVGCFSRDSKYHVYSTDERYKAYNEKSFDTAIEAYKEVAKRLGLNYPDAQNSFISGQSRIKCAASALEYWDYMCKRYGNSVDGQNAKYNRETLLLAIKSELERQQGKKCLEYIVGTRSSKRKTRGKNLRPKSYESSTIPAVMAVLAKTLTRSEYESVRGALPAYLRMSLHE